MIFIYEKETNELVGITTRIFDNGKWREPTIEELYPKSEHDKLGCVVVKDSPKYFMNPDAWQFKLNEEGIPVGIVRKPQPATITLSTNAKDTDGDGMPELPADGKSKATIDITIKDSKGKLVKKEVEFVLRTTGGGLSARRITTKTGKAKVQLTSTTETVTVTVNVEAEGARGGEITFELMPPE